MDYVRQNVNKTPLEMNHGMIPFMLPLGGKTFTNTNDENTDYLKLRYGRVNWNVLHPGTAFEIANNLSGNPMQIASIHEPTMNKNLEVLFYQSNEVRDYLYYMIKILLSLQLIFFWFPG